MAETKSEIYERISREVQAVLEGEESDIARMATIIPLRSIKATSSGIKVFFIHMLAIFDEL